jgi:peptide deformylase
MILQIRSVGEPVLRERTRALTREEILLPQTQDLIASMRETMHQAPGVGLAAPQIGMPLQLAVIEDRKAYHKDIPPDQLAERERKPVGFHVIVNPVLTLESPPEIEFFEGCLSLPGFMAVVGRAHKVRVECLNHKGHPQTIHASGWYARILQHEIDHLAGTVYIDRMRSPTFSTLENYNRYWKSRPSGKTQPQS